MAARTRIAAATISAISVMLLFSTAAARPCSADPVTISFTLFPDPTDVVNLMPAMGRLTYDTSVIPMNGGLIIDDAGRLARDIAFTWSGTSWTDANAGVYALQFGEAGNLLHIRMGGAPNGLTTLVINPLSDAVNDFILTSPFFSYTLLGQPEERVFIGMMTSPAIVPEPGTLLLLGSGAAYLVRRRMRATSH